MIVSKEKVRAAVTRAMALYEDADVAIRAVAQALCLDVEVVREAMEEVAA